MKRDLLTRLGVAGTGIVALAYVPVFANQMPEYDISPREYQVSKLDAMGMQLPKGVYIAPLLDENVDYLAKNGRGGGHGRGGGNSSGNGNGKGRGNGGPSGGGDSGGGSGGGI